jgi:hypothetical protein
LELDSAMVPAYTKALLNDLHLPYVGGIVDELHTEVADATPSHPHVTGHIADEALTNEQLLKLAA